MTTATATLSLGELIQQDIEIGHRINATHPAIDPDGARKLLRERRHVRNEIERRKAASNN